MTAKKLGRSPQVTISISQAAIKDSITRDSSHCMIAEAIKESVPGATYISVDLQTVRFSDPKKGERYTYLTPRVAQIALVNFDQGIKPEPFAFRLRAGQTTQSGGRAPKSKPSLRRTVDGAGCGSTIPERVGGKPPPVSKGRRRIFGISGLTF